eukprot:3203899-Rhodomonas_salina.1
MGAVFGPGWRVVDNSDTHCVAVRTTRAHRSERDREPEDRLRLRRLACSLRSARWAWERHARRQSRALHSGGIGHTRRQSRTSRSGNLDGTDVVLCNLDRRTQREAGSHASIVSLEVDELDSRRHC